MVLRSRSVNRYQPKFPRRRNPSQVRLGRILRFAFLLLAIVFVGMFFIGQSDELPLVEQPGAGSMAEQPGAQPASQPTGQAGARGEPTLEERENINLAGITAPKPVASVAPVQPAPQAAPQSLPATPVPAELAAPASVDVLAGRETPSAGATSPAPLTPAEQALAYGNPWGIPFVGYDLEEVAGLLGKRHAPLQPKSFGNTLPGIMNTLPAPGKGAGRKSGKSLALTFAAQSPEQVFDTEIISLLKAEKIPVTLFVTSQWIAANKQAFALLSQEPLVTIAAHGKKFRPCSVNGQSFHGVPGTASVIELLQEVEGNARDIHRLTSRRPVWFHGATGNYDDVALRIITEDLGFFVVGASLYLSPEQVATPELFAESVLKAKDTDIIYCPLSTVNGSLYTALGLALPRLKGQDMQVVPLPSTP